MTSEKRVSDEGLKAFKSVIHRIGPIEMTPARPSDALPEPKPEHLDFAYEALGLKLSNGSGRPNEPYADSTKSRKS